MKPTAILTRCLCVLALGASLELRAEIPLPPHIVFGTFDAGAEPAILGRVERGGRLVVEVPGEVVDFEGQLHYVLRVPMESNIGAPGPSGAAARQGDVLTAILIDGAARSSPSLPLPLEMASVLRLDFGGPPLDRFVRSDCDASGASNITDPVFLLNYLFSGGEQPSCLEACDANDKDGLNLTDAIYVLNFLFAGGTPPAPPYPECGRDATADTLTCGSYAPCGGGEGGGAGGGGAAPEAKDAKAPRGAGAKQRLQDLLQLAARGAKSPGAARTPAVDRRRAPRDGSAFGVFDASLEISPETVQFGEVAAAVPVQALERTITIVNRAATARQLDLASLTPEFAVVPENVDLPAGESAVAVVRPLAVAAPARLDEAPAGVEVSAGSEVLARLEIAFTRDPQSLAVAVGAANAVLEEAAKVSLPIEAALPAGLDSLVLAVEYDARYLGEATWTWSRDARRQGDLLQQPGLLTLQLRAPSRGGTLALGTIEFPAVGLNTPGSYPVVVREATASDTNGLQVPVSATHGEVCIRSPDAAEREDCRRRLAAADQADHVLVLRHLFQGDAAPPCLAHFDRNGDGAVELDDLVGALAARHGR
jgi:hypothetical protein